MYLRVPAAVLLAVFVCACAESAPPEAQQALETTAAAAPAPDQAPEPFQLNSEQAEGKVVYETMCWSCHGSAGRGDGPAVRAGAVAPPGDFSMMGLSPATVRQLQASFRAEAGSLDPGHPHMQNVLSIIDADAFAGALGYLPALTYPPELPGSAIAGHTNYVLRCQGCHGTTGRGDGPGAGVLEVAPANFTLDTLLASGNFEAAFQKIRQGGGGVHGSSMPAWAVMFSDGEVWDLVAYISTFRPGLLSQPPGSVN
jgi:mono/diheme cytochrome c family protein